MAVLSIQPNREGLIAFLDFAGDKGLMKKGTAGAYKKASNIILRILDEEEAIDLSKVDLEDVFFRHRNKAAGKIAPRTLKTYETRTRSAARGSPSRQVQGSPRHDPPEPGDHAVWAQPPQCRRPGRWGERVR